MNHSCLKNCTRTICLNIHRFGTMSTSTASLIISTNACRRRVIQQLYCRINIKTIGTITTTVPLLCFPLPTTYNSSTCERNEYDKHKDTSQHQQQRYYYNSRVASVQSSVSSSSSSSSSSATAFVSDWMNRSNNSTSRTFDSGPLHDIYHDMTKNYNNSNNDGSSFLIQKDEHQLHALESLERLRHELLSNPPSSLPTVSQSSQCTIDASNRNWSQSLFSMFNPVTSKNHHHHPVTSASCTKPKISGVYLHGGVGCGKTFLMNTIFYNSLKNTIWEKECQKTHFHRFMLQIHSKMHIAHKQQQQDKLQSTGSRMGTSTRANSSINTNAQNVSDTIIPYVIQEIIKNGRLLLFDEFQVTDVADALLLQRLFTGLWENNCIVVATSNRPPYELYKDGLQRDRFIPFIHLLENNCAVVSMWNSEIDYRLIRKAYTGPSLTESAPGGSDTEIDSERQIQQRQNTNVYFCDENYIYTNTATNPLKSAKKQFDELFYTMINHTAIIPMDLTTQGRKIYIPQAALTKGIARFTFSDLCQKAMGASDYIVIGQTFHTVFVEQVPQLTLDEINYVRRFIIFIDTMYESNVKLIIHSKTIPSQIFNPSNHKTSKRSSLKCDNNETSLLYQQDEVFAFDRTVSRLQEMSSIPYLQKQHKRWCSANYSSSTTDITKPVKNTSSGSTVELGSTSIITSEASNHTTVEPKASLLSNRRAVVSVSPS